MKRIIALSLLFSAIILGGCSDRGNKELVLANDLIEAAKFDEAEKLIQKVIKEFPENAKAYNNLGFVYAISKRPVEARAQYLKALDLYAANEPGNSEEIANTYNNLGLLDDLLGNDLEAIKSYKKSVEESHDFARALHNLGTVHREIGDFKEAISWFDKALMIDPYVYQTRIFKALTLLDAKLYPEAVQLYTDLLADDPFKVYIQTHLAFAHIKAGDLEKAQNVLSDAQAMNPGDMVIQSYIALLLLEQGKQEKAEELSKILLAILNNPEEIKKMRPGISPDLARNVGVVRLRLGDREAGLKWLRKAIQINPVDLEAARQLQDLEKAGAPTAEETQDSEPDASGGTAPQ